MMQFHILNESSTSCRTCGLVDKIGMEIKVDAGSSDLLEPARDFLVRVGDYVCEGNPIRSGETMAQGYWVVRFVMDKQGILLIHEFDDDWKDFVPGAKRTLTYWRDQTAMCVASNLGFDPPMASTMVAISGGVLQGEAVEGVRYRAPQGMSGWYFTTTQYDGDVGHLSVVHLYHVSKARPDLTKYFGLPPGSYFDLRRSSEIGFSNEVASDS